jgi:hypothetical protein
MASEPVRALSPIENDEDIRAVTEAASAIDYERFAELSTADNIHDLSSNTTFEALEISPDAVFKTSDHRFEASGIVYITLNYGGSRDSVSMPDSYPAVVRGRLSNNSAEIEEILVDTSNFYR